MYHAFPGVEMLSTISNIGIVSGLIKLMGEKPTIITGLIITLLVGTFPKALEKI